MDFVSGRPGFQIPTPSFLGLMFVWKKSNWKLLNSKQALKFMSLTEYREYHCFFKTTKKNVRSKLHIYQIRLRINFEKSGTLYMWNLSRNCFTFKQWSMVWLSKDKNAFVCFDFCSFTFPSCSSGALCKTFFLFFLPFFKSSLLSVNMSVPVTGIQ